VFLPYVLPSIAPTSPYFFKKSVEEKSKEIVESAAGAVSQVHSPISKLGEEISTSPIDVSIPLVSSSVSEASASTSIPVKFRYSMGEEAVIKTTADSVMDVSFIPTHTEEILDHILNTAAWEVDNTSIVSVSLPSIDSPVPTTDEMSSDLIAMLGNISSTNAISLDEESVIIIKTITIPPMGKAGPVLVRPDSIANVGLPENEDGQFLSDYLASI